MCVCYCSKQHQQQDSKFHARVCAEWQSIYNEKRASSNCSITALRNTVDAVLNVHDAELLQLLFHRCCCQCRSQGDDLVECEDCHMCWHCPKHDGQHQCSELRLAHDCELLMTQYHHRPPVTFPTEIRNTITSLPSSWEEYFRWRNMTGLHVMSDASKAIISSILMLPLTILFVLDKLAYPIHSTMTIHVVGARLYEVVSSSACEELLHVLPSVQHLNLLLVGPDITSSEWNDPEYTHQPLCDECVAQGRTMTVLYANALYHEYAARKGYRAPDIAIAPNAGMFILQHRPLMFQACFYTPLGHQPFNVFFSQTSLVSLLVMIKKIVMQIQPSC